MKKLYLDIDGVLLIKDGTPAEGLVPFLKYVTDNFDCYWLTTHCDGDATMPFLYLVGKLPNEAIPFIERIKPTKFGTLKTDALDFESDFLWLDDTLFEAEERVLKERGVRDRMILIDLVSFPNQLIEMMDKVV